MKNKINFPEIINIKESLFFILFFYCSIFILIPSSLFLFNIVEWEYDYWLLIYNLQFGLAVTSILIVIQFSLNLISKKISSLLIHSIILLTLIILLNDIIFPPEVGLIGLEQLNTETSFFFNIGEIFVILFLLIYYFSSYRKIYLKTISIFIIFLSVALFSTCILLSLSNNDNYKFEKTKIIKNKIKIEDLPNIYLFHLDGLQSDFAEKILDDNKNISENLTGFTFFKKNIANYAYTQSSVLSLLTSTTYKGQTKKKWEDKIKNGLLNELKKTGYSIQLYGKNIFNNLYSEKIYFDKVYSNKEILKKNNINHPLIIKFTQILIIKYFPNLFSKKAIKLGEDAGIKFFTILNKSIPLKTINIQDGFGKYNSILATRSLINDLETLDKKNIFTYVVLDIPHYPYLFDNNCNWYESRTSNLVHDYYNQSVCAMNLVNNFIKKLKDINQYNDSIIIIYSDHGSHAVTQLIKKKSLKVVKDSKVPFDNTMSPWSIERLEAHARSVLMIKPKDSYNKIKYSTKKTQLLDVYPTLLDFLNIRISNTIEGKAIFSKDKQIYNQRLFSLIEPLKHLSSTAKYQNFKVSYDDNGVLQLEPQKKLRGGEFDLDLFFSKKFDQINQGKIKLFSKTVDKKIITYVDDIFVDGMDIINHWGSWTQSDKVTFALKLPQDKKFNFLTFDIVDAFVNEENKKISAKFFLNKKQIGKVSYNYKNKNFPDRIKFKINSNDIYKNKYNLIEISIEGATSPKSLKKGFDKRNLGLAIKEIYFE